MPRMLSWQIESAFRGGVAGVIVFSFTDDWYRGGDPRLGVGPDHRPANPNPRFTRWPPPFASRPIFRSRANRTCPSSSPATTATPTLKPAWSRCASSTTRITKSSWWTTAPPTRPPSWPSNLPRSAISAITTNLGFRSRATPASRRPTGEIVAFTDADCRADEDWLYYLVGDLGTGEFAGMGGPNLLPADDSPHGDRGDGFARRSGPRDADRSRGGTHPGLQHGLFQKRA